MGRIATNNPSLPGTDLWRIGARFVRERALERGTRYSLHRGESVSGHLPYRHVPGEFVFTLRPAKRFEYIPTNQGRDQTSADRYARTTAFLSLFPGVATRHGRLIGKCLEFRLPAVYLVIC